MLRLREITVRSLSPLFGPLIRKLHGTDSDVLVGAQLEALFNPILRKFQGSRIQHNLRESILREIDLENSLAFALESSDVTGMIFINPAYARLRGLDVARFRVEASQQIKSALELFGQENDLIIDVFTA